MSSERKNLLRGRDVTVVDISESLAELEKRYQLMNEPPPPQTVVLQMIGDAVIDAFSVLDNMEDDEIEKIKLDPAPMMSDDIISDPNEAFQFNVVEELTTEFVRASRKEINRPFGFNVVRLSKLVIYS